MNGWHRSELLFAWVTMTGIPMTVKSNMLTNTTKATMLPITRLEDMIFDWKNLENDVEPSFLFFIFLVLLSLSLRLGMTKRIQLKDRQTVVCSLLRIDRTVGWMRVGGFLLQNITNVANENERIVNSDRLDFYFSLKQRGVLNNWNDNRWETPLLCTDKWRSFASHLFFCHQKRTLITWVEKMLWRTWCSISKWWTAISNLMESGFLSTWRIDRIYFPRQITPPFVLLDTHRVVRIMEETITSLPVSVLKKK